MRGVTLSLLRGLGTATALFVGISLALAATVGVIYAVGWAGYHLHTWLAGWAGGAAADAVLGILGASLLLTMLVGAILADLTRT